MDEKSGGLRGGIGSMMGECQAHPSKVSLSLYIQMDGLELVRNKSHMWGFVSEFGLGLVTEVQIRTSRQEFWTHVTLGFPEPLLSLPKPRQFLLLHPRRGDARRERVG